MSSTSWQIDTSRPAVIVTGLGDGAIYEFADTGTPIPASFGPVARAVVVARLRAVADLLEKEGQS